MNRSPGSREKLTPAELKAYALRLLGGRALSTAQLKARLRLRAQSGDDVEAVVASLREYGFLNDQRFAEGFATARRDSGSFGAQRVLSDLMRKKVGGGMARQVVEQTFAQTDEVKLIEDYLRRKFRNTDLAALLAEPNKLASVFRRLRTAGFSPGNSIRVLKRFAVRADELESEEDPEGGLDPA
jgi:regulatory protein